MRRTRARLAAPTLFAAFLAGVAVPATAQEHGPADLAMFGEDLATLRGKFEALADAMGGDLYQWRPMEGVRSVSEVYMLIAAEAYFMPSFWGAEPPEGITISNALFAELEAITDRAAVLEHLRSAFAYCTAALGELDAATLDREIPFFGQERTIGTAIHILLTDMHEHLGQSIAYARMNRVVPPWSAASGG